MNKLRGTLYVVNQEEALKRALKEAQAYFGRESVNVKLLEAAPHARTFGGTVEEFVTEYIAWTD